MHHLPHRRVMLLALLSLVGATTVVNASYRQYSLLSAERTRQAYTHEMRRHVPLHPPLVELEEPFQYVVIEGTVVSQAIQRKTAEEGTECGGYSAWARVELDLRRAKVLGVSAHDVKLADVSLVSRHAAYYDQNGDAIITRYGTGSERYNRLAVGDHILAVGVRPLIRGKSNPVYCSAFAPSFSIVFSSVVKNVDTDGDQVCLVSWSELDGEEGGPFSGAPWTLVDHREYERAFHCFDMTVDDAFNDLVAICAEGAVE